MKSLIKKLLREGLLKESQMKTAQEVGLSDKIFYHGTRMKIDKLDPEFRQKNADAMAGKRSASAKEGLGIYITPNLGFDPTLKNLTYAEDGSTMPSVNGGGPPENQPGDPVLHGTGKNLLLRAPVTGTTGGFRVRRAFHL